MCSYRRRPKSSLKMSAKRPVTDVWCVTENDLWKVSFLWSINRFSYMQHKNGLSIRSSLFGDSSDEKVQWFLELFPNGSEPDNKDYVSLFLELFLHVKTVPEELSARFNWFIVDAKGAPTNRRDLNHVFKVGEMDWGSPQFVKKSTLFDPKNGLLLDGCLTLCCEVSYVKRPTTRSGRSVNPNRRKQSLSEDISRLYDSMKDSDIIVVVEDREYRAHKLVLKTRSSVFSNMFDSGLSESRSNRVIIKDMKKKVFEVMLRFIYTGTIEKQTLEMSMDLFSAADKYDLEDLRKASEDLIVAQLTVETVSDVLVLAYRHSAQSLMNSAIHFLRANAQSVMKTEAWQKILDLPDLLNQVLLGFAK